MSDCGCYVAHGVEHLCPYHEIYLPTRATMWVEAELCRECICDELERHEAEIVRLQARLRKAKVPREDVLPPQTSPFEIGDQGSDSEAEHNDDDDPKQHPCDHTSPGVPDFF